MRSNMYQHLTLLSAWHTEASSPSSSYCTSLTKFIFLQQTSRYITSMLEACHGSLVLTE